MRPELEAILRAYQATKEATGEEANRLRIIYQSRLEDVLQRCPGLSQESLQSMIA